MSSPLEIRLLRKNATGRSGAAKDDIITARREGGNIRIVHKDSLNQEKFSLLLTQIGLPDYLRMLFHSLCLDEDPFESLQFSAPGFPATLVRITTLDARGSLRDTFYDMARTLQESWFADEPSPLDTAFMAVGADDESTDSELEFADLPPLIPVRCGEQDCCKSGARCWLNRRDYV